MKKLTNTLSDKEILQLTVTDNKIVYSLIFDRYYNKVYSFCNYLLKDSETSKEISMDIMFKILEKKESISLEEGQNLMPYLYRATKNAVLNHLRKAKIITVSINDNPFISSISDSNLTDSGLDYKDLEETITQALNNLPEQRKKIFMLSREEHLTYSEIAERLNISVNTVRNQMSASIQYLKKELKGVNGLYVIFFLSLFR